MSRHIAVIGGGIIGLSCAYYLAKRGFRVTLLERGKAGHDCCSLGNAGMIVPSHFEPLAAPGMLGYGLRQLLNPRSPFRFKLRGNPGLIRWGWLFARHCTKEHVERSSRLLMDLNVASRSLYQELHTESGNAFSLEPNGLVMLCRTRSGWESEKRLADHADAMGLNVRILTRGDVAELELNTRLSAEGGVHFLDDCHLDPNALVAWLTGRLRELGVEIVYEAEVREFTTENKRIAAVVTSRGEFAADEYVLAAGVYSGQLAKKLGIRIPLQGGKGYSVNLPVSTPPKHCFILVEGRIAVTPMGNGIRFAGTMELAGEDLSVNQRRMEGIIRSISQYMPDFQAEDFRGLGVWSGLRPCSADGLPFLGRSRSISNLIVATGHSMMGVSMGPITGKIVADIASDRPPELSLESLDPERFHR